MPTNGPVGERIAIFRRRRGLSQSVLAGLIGRSVSWLSQVERGTRAVDRMSVLIDLSRVLKVDIAELTGQPFALAPNGGLEPEGLADIRRVLMRYSELPSAINPSPSTVSAPPDLIELRSRVETAWRLRQASRYGQLGRQIANLITDAEQATQHYRAQHGSRLSVENLDSCLAQSKTDRTAALTGNLADYSSETFHRRRRPQRAGIDGVEAADLVDKPLDKIGCLDVIGHHGNVGLENTQASQG